VDLRTLEATPPWEWPRDAEEILINALQNPRAPARDRMTAAELAGDLPSKDDEIAGVLLSIVSNASEPPLLRASAAISLGPVLEEVEMEGFDEPLSEPPIAKELFLRIQETFRKVYSDKQEPKELRRRILEASVRSSQEWHTDAIRAAFSSDDQEWKLTAVFAMRYVQGFDKEILEMLDSRNPDIHFEAVLAAGECELEAAWPHLEDLLTSGNTEKRLLLAAIEAAGSIPSDEALPILLDLAGSRDEEIAEAADDALSMAQGRAEFEEFEEEEEDEDEEEESR
jgi:HEAT repeat protein